jgi:hypothetical protein
MADLYGIREVVTGTFYERHVVMVRASNAAHLTEIELDEVAKKVTENLYQSRDVRINTVLVLGWHEVLKLKSEVMRMQDRYEHASLDHEFITGRNFPHYQRGSKGAAPSRKQRASFIGLRPFKYGIIAVRGEHGPRFKIHHYGGVL